MIFTSTSILIIIFLRKHSFYVHKIFTYEFHVHVNIVKLKYALHVNIYVKI
jgi:hypothetical protein